MMHIHYSEGDWDAAVAIAESFIGEVERGSAHYLAAAAYARRAEIRVARGEAGADDDAEAAVRFGYRVGDPQILYPALAVSAFVLYESGATARGADRGHELLELSAGTSKNNGLASTGFVPLAWLAVATDDAERYRRALEHMPDDVLWVKPAREILAGEPLRAADLLEEMGALSEEALTNMRSGEPAQVERALRFYRSVGAVRYVHECERALAATA
jgi:hypothetical protein